MVSRHIGNWNFSFLNYFIKCIWKCWPYLAGNKSDAWQWTGLGYILAIGYAGIGNWTWTPLQFFLCTRPAFKSGYCPWYITPPGYFFTRIAALHHIQNCQTPGDTMSVVTQNTSGDASQKSLFVYWNIWKWAINALSIENKLDENMIITLIFKL